jgi:hypothetical protein
MLLTLLTSAFANPWLTLGGEVDALFANGWTMEGYGAYDDHQRRGLGYSPTTNRPTARPLVSLQPQVGAVFAHGWMGATFGASIWSPTSDFFPSVLDSADLRSRVIVEAELQAYLGSIHTSAVRPFVSAGYSRRTVCLVWDDDQWRVDVDGCVRQGSIPLMAGVAWATPWHWMLEASFGYSGNGRDNPTDQFGVAGMHGAISARYWWAAGDRGGGATDSADSPEPTFAITPRVGKVLLVTGGGPEWASSHSLEVAFLRWSQIRGHLGVGNYTSQSDPWTEQFSALNMTKWTPLNIGLAWAPDTHVILPYVGGDFMLTKLYSFDSLGARLRLGADWMVAGPVGLNLDLGLTVVSWIPIAQGGLGVVVRL